MKLTTDDRAALQGAIRVLMEILQQSPDEVPDIIHEWPTADSHLRGDFWKDRDGDVWGWEPSKLVWQMWSHEHREWALRASSLAWMNCTLTRTTDPSLPRTWDTLGDVPDDVERAVGKYQSYPCELERSPLSGTGWMMRVDHPYVLQQWVEYMGLDEDNLTDIEEVIDHE